MRISFYVKTKLIVLAKIVRDESLKMKTTFNINDLVFKS